MKLESYGPDGILHHIIHKGKLVISIIIMCKDKFLPEFQSFQYLYFSNNYYYTDNYRYTKVSILEWYVLVTGSVMSMLKVKKSSMVLQNLY